jgi:aspartyl-tRNA(Asn)/glutamyl-tRNA(Gln) amidotransferase subunit A
MPDRLLLKMSLVEAGDLIRRRVLSPVELAKAVLARIAALDPQINAFTTRVEDDVVLASARAAEAEIARGGYRGPLHGIPVGVKDLLDTAGLRTTYGSAIFRDYVPAADGAVPARLRDTGAVITGKTATHEFGRGITTNNHFFGPTLNPWNLAHVPGGSSGGAGASMAARMGPIQIGTDGAGSIRFPAAWCGVVGYKPTLGVVSNRGNIGSGNGSFSTPGPIAGSVRDCAVTAQALAGFDPEYAYSRPGPPPELVRGIENGVRGLRIGTSADLLEPAPEPAVRAAYDATLRRLEQLGAELCSVRLPHQHLVIAGVTAMFAVEADPALDELIGERPRQLSPRLARIREHIPHFDAAACARAQLDRQRIRRDYAVAFCDVDVLVSPVAPCPAPRIDTDEAQFVLRCVPYTGAANLAGLPAVSLPAGLADGLPLAVQVIGPVGGDALVLRVAYALEQAAAEHRIATPPLVA